MIMMMMIIIIIIIIKRGSDTAVGIMATLRAKYLGICGSILGRSSPR